MKRIITRLENKVRATNLVERAGKQTSTGRDKYKEMKRDRKQSKLIRYTDIK